MEAKSFMFNLREGIFFEVLFQGPSPVCHLIMQGEKLKSYSVSDIIFSSIYAGLPVSVKDMDIEFKQNNGKVTAKIRNLIELYLKTFIRDKNNNYENISKNMYIDMNGIDFLVPLVGTYFKNNDDIQYSSKYKILFYPLPLLDNFISLVKSKPNEDEKVNRINQNIIQKTKEKNPLELVSLIFMKPFATKNENGYRLINLVDGKEIRDPEIINFSLSGSKAV